VYHGEASSIEVDRSDRIDEMTRVRAKYDLYPPKDKFNIDESGLWWKLTPNQTLATEAGSGSKALKDRITLAFTCNADGSKKLDTWVIGC